MTEELKKHLSKLLSHSYQMGVSQGYVNGFKDAEATLKGKLNDLDQAFGVDEFSGYKEAVEILKTAIGMVESGNGMVRKIMDDDLKKLWGELDWMLLDPLEKSNSTPEEPDNTFLNRLIKDKP